MYMNSCMSTKHLSYGKGIALVNSFCTILHEDLTSSEGLIQIAFTIKAKEIEHLLVKGHRHKESDEEQFLLYWYIVYYH